MLLLLRMPCSCYIRKQRSCFYENWIQKLETCIGKKTWGVLTYMKNEVDLFIKFVWQRGVEYKIHLTNTRSFDARLWEHFKQTYYVLRPIIIWNYLILDYTRAALPCGTYFVWMYAEKRYRAAKMFGFDSTKWKVLITWNPKWHDRSNGFMCEKRNIERY